MYHKAVGYSYDTTKIFMPAGAKEPVYAPYREHVPPDTTACIFWLKNRRPAQWRDKIQQELAGPDGAPLVPVIHLGVDRPPRETEAQWLARRQREKAAFVNARTTTNGSE